MPTLYDNFERVRQYIDQHQGGGGDMSAYVTKDELSAQSYLTSIPSEYITDTELSACGYITSDDVAQMGYITSIPSTYASYNGVYSYLYDTLGISHGGSQGVSYIEDAELHNAELSGVTLINGISTDELPTYAAISAMGYVSAVSEGNFDSVVNLEGMSKIAAEDGLEIDAGTDFIYLKSQTFVNDTLCSSNIIPQITNTYTLGDGSHIYSNTYSRGVYLGTGVRMFSESSVASNDMAISLDGVSYFYLNTNRFAPNGAANNEKLDLGTADRKWNHIYGKSVNVSTAYTNDMYIGSNSFLHYIDDYTFSIYLNNSERYRFFGTQFYPINGNRDLGRSQNYWANTYTSNLFTNTAYLQDTSYTKSIVPTENAAYTLGDNSNFYNATYSTNLWLANNNRFSGSQYTIGVRVNNQETVAFGTTALRPASNNGCTLGTSSNKWSATYTSNLYADTIHNFIWTGTSAEYAALSDYTTYQIYMIKEA